MKSGGGLTKQRALIVSGLLQTLGDISLSERPDRTGTVRLGPTNPMYAMWSGTAWPGMNRQLPPTF